MTSLIFLLLSTVSWSRNLTPHPLLSSYPHVWLWTDVPTLQMLFGLVFAQSISQSPSCLPYADEDCAIQSKATRLKSETLRLEFIFSSLITIKERAFIELIWAYLVLFVCFHYNTSHNAINCFIIMNTQGTAGLGQRCIRSI